MTNTNVIIATGIFPPEIGGPASYVLTLAQRLAGNFTVTVVTYSSSFRDKNDRSLPFRVVRVWNKNPKFYRNLLYFFKLLVNAGKSNLILSLNATNTGLPAMFAARILAKRFIVKIPGDYAWEIAVNRGQTDLLLDDFQTSKKHGLIWFYHVVQTFVCRKADGIIVPSEYLADIVKGWGIDPKKIRVIYNGVDFEAKSLTREEARIKIGISGNIILSVGRLVSWKGFKMLIKIMPQLFEINQFFRLVIIGSGPEFQKLQIMIKNLRLDKKVYLVGRRTKDELATYLAAADIFVLNTGYEGFSHQIVEAMAAGVPIITTSAGGNREIVHQGENGFMIKYNDEFNLVEAIKTVWQSPELRQKFVEQGKKTAEFFSVQKMINQTKDFLINV